jgi:hypothetical protein
VLCQLFFHAPQDFIPDAEWPQFLARCCEPGQATPQAGTLDTGDTREVMAWHDALVRHSVFQLIFKSSGLQPVAFEARVRAQSATTGQKV